MNAQIHPALVAGFCHAILNFFLTRALASDSIVDLAVRLLKHSDRDESPTLASEIAAFRIVENGLVDLEICVLLISPAYHLH
jgi:hypothetical protein